MKIIQLFNHYRQPGGEEVSVKRIARTLSEQMNADVQRLWSQSSVREDFQHKVSQPLRAFWNPATIKQVRLLQRESKAKAWLVHNILPTLSLGVYGEALKQEIPIIHYLHNYRPFSVSGNLWGCGKILPKGLRLDFSDEVRYGSWRESRTQTAWLAMLLLAAHRLGWFNSVKVWIALSQFSADRIAETGIPKERIRVIPHSWDSIRSPDQILEDRGYYFFLGRLVDEKGVRVLFKTWDILSAEMGEKCPMLLIAGQGPLEAEVVMAASINPRIRFEHHVDGLKKQQLIASCRAMIVPSLWWEPLGLVVYEARDFFKPVLAASSGGLPELVSHRENGLLHPPGDHMVLAQQIQEIQMNPRTAREWGEEGGRWLTGFASIKKWSASFTDALELIKR